MSNKKEKKIKPVKPVKIEGDFKVELLQRLENIFSEFISNNTIVLYSSGNSLPTKTLLINNIVKNLEEIPTNKWKSMLK